MQRVAPTKNRWVLGRDSNRRGSNWEGLAKKHILACFTVLQWLGSGSDQYGMTTTDAANLITPSPPCSMARLRCPKIEGCWSARGLQAQHMPALAAGRCPLRQLRQPELW